MKHPATRELYQYWNQRRGLRPAPDRGDIEPGRLTGVLADAFVLALDDTRQYPFRIAGTRICALFCRELKRTPFADLWDDDHMRDLLDTVVQDGVGFVCGAHATVDDIRTDLELLVLPLTQGGHRPIRLIGTLAPLARPYWLGARPVSRLTVGMHRHIGAPFADFAHRFVSGAQAERTREGLRVLDGGRR